MARDLVKDILGTVGAWPLLPLALLVWGFAPGFFNRLIALGFPRDDERRYEMVAELYDVPRWEQPFWVAQQAERLITEGLPARVRSRRRGSTGAWRFDDGVRWHRRFPKTFMIPSAEARNRLEVGDWAKLLYFPPSGTPSLAGGERLWAEVTGRARQGYLGRLLVAPSDGADLTVGATVWFSADNVIDIVFPQGLDVTVDDIAPDGDDLRENGSH